MRLRSYRLGFLIADRTPSKHSAFQHLTSLVWIILKATLLVSRFCVCFLWISESMVRESQLPVPGRGLFPVGLFFVYGLIRSSRLLDDTSYFL